MNGPVRSVPWALAERIRAQARNNHGQSLEELHNRGGLDPVEFVGAMRGLSWRELRALMKTTDCNAELMRLIEESR